MARKDETLHRFESPLNLTVTQSLAKPPIKLFFFFKLCLIVASVQKVSLFGNLTDKASDKSGRFLLHTNGDEKV